MKPPAINLNPADKIDVIERSLRCFTLGLFGIVPVLGVPFGISALLDYARVKQQLAGHWNPAAKYLTWGLATAICGILLTVVTLSIAAIIIVEELV